MIQLKDIPGIPEHTCVTVQAMVVKVHQPQKVGEKRVKQDVTIADTTGKATLTLWDNDIGALEANNAYQ
jgi:ssDNA-binding replication factor A large subunit